MSDGIMVYGVRYPAQKLVLLGFKMPHLQTGRHPSIVNDEREPLGVSSVHANQVLMHPAGA